MSDGFLLLDFWDGLNIYQALKYAISQSTGELEFVSKAYGSVIPPAQFTGSVSYPILNSRNTSGILVRSFRT